MKCKTSLYIASALALTVGGFLFFFMNKNVGMQRMAKSLIDIGRQLQSYQKVDVADLLLSANTVRKFIQTVCNKSSIQLKDILQSSMNIDGAVTCDGLTQSSSERKYYDFVVHFIKEE